MGTLAAPSGCTLWQCPPDEWADSGIINMTWVVASIVALMWAVGPLSAAAFVPVALQSQVPVDAPGLFDSGQTMEQFVQTSTRQREAWIRIVAAAKIDPRMVERFRRAGKDLRLLIVAEDWCPDSVHTVPYVAALAAQAGIDVRIVDRGSGAAIMKRHPAPDGRAVTPVVVLLRRGVDVGAWVERPSVLQSLFQSIRTNPESAEKFAQRQTWYEADGGRTTVAETVALAEQKVLAK
jgi:hypothetical protein